MSFGFSVGDFLTLAKLAANVVASFGFGAEDLKAATEVGQQAILAQGNGDSIIILSFRALQAQRIKEMQARLLELSFQKLHFVGPGRSVNDEVHAEIDSLLNSYVVAIRNYETLSQESIHSLLRPQSVISRYAQYGGLKAGAPRLSPELIKVITRSSTGELNFRQLNREVSDSLVLRQASSDRLWMGSFGGIALIGPVLLMSLHRDLRTSLITSSVATAIFVVVLAMLGKNLKGQEVLGATAAYAAVLVVFVGTSMAPIS